MLCQRVFRRIAHRRHSEKSLSITHCSIGSALTCVCIHTTWNVKTQERTSNSSDVCQYVFFSLFIKLLLIAIGLGRISGWTFIFSITSFCFLFHRSGLRVMMCALFFLSLSAESVDLCEILFWLYIFTRSFNRFIPSVLSKWFNFVYRSPFGCVWNSINLHKNRCAYPKHSPPLCLPCRGKILVC